MERFTTDNKRFGDQVWQVGGSLKKEPRPCMNAGDLAWQEVWLRFAAFQHLNRRAKS